MYYLYMYVVDMILLNVFVLNVPSALVFFFSEREANCSSKNGSHKDRRSKTPVISTNQNYPFWATAKSPYSSPIPPRFASS